MRNSLKFVIELGRDNLKLTREDFLAYANDYHDYSPIQEMFAAAPIMANAMKRVFNAQNLADITLTSQEYIEVVNEVFPEAEDNNGGGTSFFDRYIDAIRNSKPGDVINNEDADSTASDIRDTFGRICHVSDSHVNNAARAYGLVIGHVQSGKTRNYVGLALKAYDEGWNTVIVLTSNNTALAQQTNERANREFNRVGCQPHDLRFLDGNLYSGQIIPNNYYFGMAQKQIHHLGRIRDWLDQKNAHGEIGQIRLLVIDDEADNATPDTQQLNGRQLSDSDIEMIADEIRRRQDNSIVSDWVRGLLELDCAQVARDLNPGFNDDQINNFLEGAKIDLEGGATKTAILNLIRDQNKNVSRLLQLGEKIYGNQNINLAEAVAATFDNNANRRNSVTNWKTLRDLAWYCFDVRPSRSRINEQIVRLFSRADKTVPYTYDFDRMAYVGYTATPYANVLNEHPDQDPLAADFMLPMRKSRHYFGMARIFGESEGPNDTATNMNIVREIDDEQQMIDDIRDVYDDFQQGTVTVHPDLSVSIVKIGDNGEEHCEYDWSSLKRALAWLFCSAAVRRIRRMQIDGDERRSIHNRWTTMLFNIGSETSLHRFQKGIVQRYLDWLGDQNHPEARQNFIAACHNCWEDERGKFSIDNFKEACSDYGEVEDYPAWDDVRVGLDWFLNRVSGIADRVHAIEVNCTGEGQLDLNRFKDVNGVYHYNDDDHIWIVCGGNKISRGLTLDGLVVTYFDRVRTSTCVDTLVQMGRWFGYREGYELLPRIWMNRNTIIEFKRMAKVERFMHKELRDSFDAYPEFTPKDSGHYARIIQFGRRLSGRSAAAILSSASAGASDTFNEMFTSLEAREGIFNLLRGFVETIDLQPGRMNRPEGCYRNQIDGDDDSGFHSYPYWRDVSADRIKQFLRRMVDETLVPVEVQTQIRAVCDEIVTQNWDVVISNPRTRGNHNITIANNINVRVGTSSVTGCEDGRVKFGKFTGSSYAFFSGVETKAIVSAEVDILRSLIRDPLWINENVSRDGCDQAIKDAEQNQFVQMLPPEIRNAMGVSRMSGLDYRDVVFGKINNIRGRRPNPILQISFVRPSNDEGFVDLNQIPFVAISYYWPNHDDTRYSWASVGFSDELPPVNRELICEHIKKIIEQNIILNVEVLKELVDKELVDSKLAVARILKVDFECALEEEASCCKRVEYNDVHECQLLPSICYYSRWFQDMRQWYQETEDKTIDVRFAICTQLEMEARDVLRDNNILRTGNINKWMLPFTGKRRDCIVRRDDFGRLFEKMAMEGNLLRLEWDAERGGWRPINTIMPQNELDDDEEDED